VDGVRFRLDLTANEKIQKFHAFKISQAGLNASHLATFGETFSRVYVGIRNDVPPTYLALAKTAAAPTHPTPQAKLSSHNNIFKCSHQARQLFSESSTTTATLPLIMDSPVVTANMPAATAHFGALKAQKDAARQESIRIAKANAPAATLHFGARKQEKDAQRALDITRAKAAAPSATLYFGKLAEEKKAAKAAKVAKSVENYSAPAATQYFNAKKAAKASRGASLQ
jgi:ribosomal protein L20